MNPSKTPVPLPQSNTNPTTTSQIIISRKQELLTLEPDEHDMLHCILSKLPKPLDLDSLISRSAALHTAHPPSKLTTLSSWWWHPISRNSVLTTTRNPHALAQQTLQEGEVYFQRHAAEIATQEAREKQFERAKVLTRKYKRPAMLAGTAVLAVVVAYYLRKSGGGSAAVGSLAGLWHAGLMLQSRAFGFMERVLR